MTREKIQEKKKIRENLYIMLFQADFHQGGDVKEQAELYLERLAEAEEAAGRNEGEADKPEETENFGETGGTEKVQEMKAVLRDRFLHVMEYLPQLDEKIAEKSKGWALSRLAKSDLAILRLAVYEILYDAEVPDSVAVNEAVELAKRYSGEKSYKFVNGVLASVVREAEGKEASDETEDAMKTAPEADENGTAGSAAQE